MTWLWLLFLLQTPFGIEPNLDSDQRSFAHPPAAFLAFLRRPSSSVEIPEKIETPKIQPYVEKIHRLEDQWTFDNVNNCADVWSLTPDETMKLQNLKDKLADIDHLKNNPHEVARFLKEYAGDVEVCEHNFRKMIDWRRSTGPDTFLEDYVPPPAFNYFPAGILKGLDIDGDPIHVERTGAADGAGLLKALGRNEMLNYGIWLREVQSRGEWQAEYESEQGHPVKAFTGIMDMKGLNRKHLSPSLISVGQEIARLVQDNYPGYAKRFLLIRAPTIFWLAWNAFKPFLDETTKQKIKFLNEKSYCDELRAFLDPSILPSAICPEGHGQAIDELSPVWEGGPISNRI
jgi:hypothetical protein